MNIRDLRYFLAVAKHQHFGQAAEACHVSQPALSMQLKKLEDYLGVTLFERTNKSVMVTSIGKQLMVKAQEIVQSVDEMQLLAQTLQDPESGQIKLGAFPTLAPYLLPKIMPNIIKLFPRMQFLLLEEKTDELLNQLKIGEIDAALLALPISDPMLESIVLFEEPFYIAMEKSHDLAKLSKINKKNIVNEKLLLLDEGHCLRKQALDVCELMGAFEQQDFRATSLETLKEMVAAGVGMTLVPKLAVSNKDNRIKYLPFCNHQYSRKIALVWRKSSARKALLEKLASEIFSVDEFNV